MQTVASVRITVGEERDASRQPASGAERAAFNDFYIATRDDVYRTVLVATRHPQRAEDAVHEAYTRALAAWDRIADHPNPAAWVARVALNQATSWWRFWSREVPEPPTPGYAADEAPMDAAIVRLIWALPRRQRQVVALRILLDQSVEETGRVLGVAPGTVKAHLNRALKHIRRSLTEAGFDERE